MLWLALPAFAVGPLDTDALASLTEPLNPRFSALREQDFQQTWLLGTRVDPRIEVVHGTLKISKKEQHAGWFALRDASGSPSVELLLFDDADTDAHDVMGWSYLAPATLPGGTWTVTLSKGTTAELSIDRQDPTSVQDRPWEDWVYTTALLGFEGLPYADMGDEPWGAPSKQQEKLVEQALASVGGDGARAALAAAIGSGLPAGSWHWEGLVEAAQEMGASDLVLEAYRHWRPMGRCSMDSFPAEVARRYADACFAAGRTGCALQLQVRIMDDHHDRMVYSSYGEAAHATQVELLDSTGIDVPRFLRGLVLDYDTTTERSVGIARQRLGRAVYESPHREAMEAQLQAWTRDTSLDAYNRFMATITLAWARSYERAPNEALMDPTGLHPLAATWLARVETDRASE